MFYLSNILTKGTCDFGQWEILVYYYRISLVTRHYFSYFKENCSPNPRWHCQRHERLILCRLVQHIQAKIVLAITSDTLKKVYLDKLLIGIVPMVFSRQSNLMFRASCIGISPLLRNQLKYSWKRSMELRLNFNTGTGIVWELHGYELKFQFTNQPPWGAVLPLTAPIAPQKCDAER